MSIPESGFGRVTLDAVKIPTYMRVTPEMITIALQDACMILLGIDPYDMTDEEMRQRLDERWQQFDAVATRAAADMATATPDQLPGHPLVQPGTAAPAPEEP